MNRDAGYKSRDNTKRTIPVETSDALVVQDNALIVQDGLGHDWGYIAQDEPTEFTLMAYTSNSSGSNIELVVHQKNEVVYEEKIAVLEFEVKDKGNAVTRLTNQLEQTLKEKEDLKAKLEQFETSSKNLTKLINSQISSKDKTGLGYGDQLNENGSSGSELFNSVFDSRSSDGDDNQTNDRFKKDNEYHAVPPPLTRNYIPPLADLSFAGLDDSVYRPTTNKTSASVSQVETSNTPPSNTSVEMPRVESVRPSGVIIKDWVSDDEEDIFQSEDSQTTVKPSFKKIEFTKARNETVKTDKQAVKPRMVNTVKVNGVNTVGQTAISIVKGNGVTTVKASAVCVWIPKMTDFNNVSKDNSVSWVLKRGNPQQALKNKEIYDSGCSRHMTGNKDFLIDYQDIHGGFVAFGGSARGGKITGKGKIRTDKLDFEDVFFVKELKFNLFSVSQMCDKKNNVLFTKTECLVFLLNLRILAASQVLLRWQSQAPRNHGGTPAQTRSERVLEQPNEPPLLEGHTSGSGEGSMEQTFELTDNVPPTPHDSPLTGGYTPGSDEGRMKLDELITLCTKLSKQVLDLEKEKDAQAVEILNLKRRVKKLERKRKSSISHPRRRKYRQVETSSDDGLDEEDASKQGRRSDKLKPMFKDKDFEELDDHMENVEEETVDAAATRVSTVSVPVSTAGVTISTAEPRTPPITTTVFDDEDVTMAMAQTLTKMKEQKAKEKGVAIIDVEDSSTIVRPVRSITTLQPLPTIDPKDKELAQRIHEEELAELERAQQERQRQKDDTNAALAKEFDEIQARIDADHELAVRLTHEEQEKYTIKERARLLAEFFDQRKKQLAAARVEAIRNKPPTKTQVKNRMITYLKHMGKYTHQQLKNKTYEEIQRLYEKEKRWIDDFQPMDTEAIKDSKNKVDSSSKPAGGSRKKTLARKRAGENKSEESTKKQKLKDVAEEQESAKSDEEAAADYEHEKEELRMWLTVVLDEEETMDPINLSAKYPIVDWESQNLGSVDIEESKWFEDTTPEGYNLLLWGDLKLWSSYITDGWYFDLLRHASREKVSSHQGNAAKDVELEAKS
ncbi:hypothetical protein Tco_1329426 [Tanacetum coccineum]